MFTGSSLCRPVPYLAILTGGAVRCLINPTMITQDCGKLSGTLPIGHLPDVRGETGGDSPPKIRVFRTKKTVELKTSEPDRLSRHGGKDGRLKANAGRVESNLRGNERQANLEGVPLVRSTFKPDRAAVRMDNGLNQTQAQTVPR